MTTQRDELVTNAVHELESALKSEVLGDLAGLDDDLEFVRGFPAHDPEFQLPTISIDDADPTWESFAPYLVDTIDNGDGTTDAIFETAGCTIPVQLDVWTDSKTQRYKLLKPLRDQFLPGFDVDSMSVDEAGLETTIDLHHGAPCRWQLEDEDNRDQEVANDAYHRRMFALEGYAKRRDRETLENATYEFELDQE